MLAKLGRSSRRENASPRTAVIPGRPQGEPESILPVVVMDSGLALRAPRNDEVERSCRYPMVRSRARSARPEAAGTAVIPAQSGIRDAAAVRSTAAAAAYGIARLNRAMKAVGRTVRWTGPGQPLRPKSRNRCPLTHAP